MSASLKRREFGYETRTRVRDKSIVACAISPSQNTCTILTELGELLVFDPSTQDEPTLKATLNINTTLLIHICCTDTVAVLYSSEDAYSINIITGQSRYLTAVDLIVKAWPAPDDSISILCEVFTPFPAIIICRASVSQTNLFSNKRERTYESDERQLLTHGNMYELLDRHNYSAVVSDDDRIFFLIELRNNHLYVLFDENGTPLRTNEGWNAYVSFRLPTEILFTYYSNHTLFFTTQNEIFAYSLFDERFKTLARLPFVYPSSSTMIENCSIRNDQITFVYETPHHISYVAVYKLSSDANDAVLQRSFRFGPHMMPILTHDILMSASSTEFFTHGPMNLRWSIQNHSMFPVKFKETVRTLLMIHSESKSNPRSGKTRNHSKNKINRTMFQSIDRLSLLNIVQKLATATFD